MVGLSRGDGGTQKGRWWDSAGEMVGLSGGDGRMQQGRW